MCDNNKAPLFIRADANTEIGTGHLMRCRALGQAWMESGGSASFITSGINQPLREMLLEEGFAVNDLAAAHPDPLDIKHTLELLSPYPGSWVVLDGYHFDHHYQQAIKEAGRCLLVIDDTAHLEHYYADIILNQNIDAPSLNYSTELYSRQLSGTSYVMLRKEFREWRDYRRQTAENAKRVLVTLGGADPDNVTLKVIHALSRVGKDDLEVVVVVGGSNPYFDVLREAVGSLPFKTDLVRNARNIPELMAWADMAVIAGGSTCWEMCYLGLPGLILILAENQAGNARGLEKRGLAINLGWHHDLTPADISCSIKELLGSAEARGCMTDQGRALVDGRGTDRVITRMQGDGLTLREVREDDCRLLWEWANDPDVRRNSFSPGQIAWEEHREWFYNKLYDSDCLILIGEDGEGGPVGQVRFDTDQGEAEIDVSVAKEKRGLGYGSRLLDLAVREYFRKTGLVAVRSQVVTENQGSIRAFEKAGFKRAGQGILRGRQFVSFVRLNNQGS